MPKATVEHPSAASRLAELRLGWKHRRRRFWRSFKWWAGRDHDLSAHLRDIDALNEIRPDEIVVITRERNGGRYIRSFLRHYRMLGADRIVVIDEGSTDGARELLAGQEGVIMLTAATSYAEAHRGRNWFDAVLQRLGCGQRIVLVDIDEYLVFSDGMRTLRDLFDAMARDGMKRLCGFMLDCYPPAPVGEARFDGSGDEMPWQVAPFFDSDGYTLISHWRGPILTGGVRRRLFGEELFLTKFPAMFNPGRAILDETIHAPQPLTANCGPIGCILLHFKYFSDFVEEHEEMVRRGAHSKGAKNYKAVVDQLKDVDVAQNFEFRGENSRRYEGPEQLCALGLMIDIMNDARG